MSPQNLTDQKILLGEDYILIWVEQFLKAKKAENKTKGTILFYRKKLKVFTDFLDSQEVKFVSQITSNIIRDFLLILEERGHNAGGIHGYFRSVKAFLKWYWDEEEIESRNPIDKIKTPKVPVEAIEGISREDFDLLLNECKSGFYGERDKAILLTLLDTGVRATELLNINLANLNLVDNSILIEQGKGRKPRYVFFGKKAKKQIRKYLSLRGLDATALFTSKAGNRIDYETLRGIVRRLALKAGVEGVSLHDFRRAFTLEQMRKKTDLLTIARLLGHTSTQLIWRYAKQEKDDLGNSYKSVIDD
jgi:site-specific recombinase XerD